jgi:hypothetical protein
MNCRSGSFVGLLSFRSTVEVVSRSEFQRITVRYDGEAASDFRERKENKMLRGFKLTAGVLCVVVPAALSGCADTIYPRLPDLSVSGGNLLTPTEQEKTIKDLTSEQKSHGAEAAKAIEKRE